MLSVLHLYEVSIVDMDPLLLAGFVDEKTHP